MTNSVPGSTYLYPGTPSPAWWNAPTNPWSIGAGTSEQGYGWGVPGFGQDPIKILTEYLPYLQSQTTGQRGGYIPGSGTYNQFRLDQPWLLGQINGQTYNNQWGSGGAGDPTTGAASEQAGDVQTRYRNAGQQLFELTGPNLEDQYSILGNAIGRSESPSGLSTAAIPQVVGPLLAQAIREGRLRPTAAGQQFMQEYFGISPQQVAQGSATVGAPAGASGYGAPGAGGAAGGGRGSAEQNALASIAASQAADQAARLVYQEWQMRTGDEQLAMSKAQQAWTQKFQETQQAWQQQYQTAGLTGQLGAQDTLAKLQQEFTQRMQQAQLEIAQAGLTGTYQGQKTLEAIQQEFAQRATEAGLTGQYNGQETLAAQQQRWQQGFQEQGQQQQGALSLLGLQSALQGPRDWAKYWQMSASAPEGLTSALGSLAGRYNFAPGYQGTPGPATLQSRTQDLLSGGQQGQGAPAGAAGAGDGQAGNAWGWNLQNWQRMSPSMQQGVLGGAEAGGAYGPDIERLLQQAAPRYTGPATAGVGL